MRRILHASLALWLALTLCAARPALAQQPAAAAASNALDTKLAAIEAAIDAKRKELGIPGLSLAIVKDDKVIYLKGLGLRNIEKNLPVTPDTLFAIGSSSKAFTAMSIAMAQDEGKLSLDDSPKKYLPYFKLQDPEADAKITIRDLLSHRSGLNRTDLGWASGALTSEEIIRVAGLAKPTAKLGEKFQYQNVMFLAAGEIAAKVFGSTWDDVIAKRIFAPLGMKRSNTHVAEMEKSDDYSLGYDYNFATKQTRHLPQRDLHAIAPAGAINSSARDMSNWLRLMLDGGLFDGKRLVSEKSFAELTTKQMAIGKTVGYGLGWFLRDWKGHKVVEHGGNIDGFNALVALMPDEKLGFVLLTNVTASSIGNTAMETVWSNLVGDAGAVAKSDAADALDPAGLPGVYTLAEAGNLEITVANEGGKMTIAVPGQPTYPLESLGANRFKLGAPAPDGFFATFRKSKEKPSAVEIYLEQPQGNFDLPRKAETSAPAAAAGSADHSELAAQNATADGKGAIEIVMRDGKPTLVVPGQPPYPLVERSADLFGAENLPENYALHVDRDAEKKVTGITLKQPNGDVTFVRKAAWAPDITVDELMAKVIDAAGGEASLRKHTSRVAEIEIDFENQGVVATGTMWAKAPRSAGSEITFTALGKKIGEARDYFDGEEGGEWSSFSQADEYTGKQLEDVRLASDFYAPLDWKTRFKTVEIKGKEKVGDEEVYVVLKTPEKGNAVTDYVSTTSFRLLKRDSVVWSETANMGIPVSTTYEDYREVDGLWLPFTTRSVNVGQGNVVARIKSIKHDVAIDASRFKER
jgi:CubicO group peptidase (beta-lactamase class C family)